MPDLLISPLVRTPNIINSDSIGKAQRESAKAAADTTNPYSYTTISELNGSEELPELIRSIGFCELAVKKAEEKTRKYDTVLDAVGGVLRGEHNNLGTLMGQLTEYDPNDSGKIANIQATTQALLHKVQSTLTRSMDGQYLANGIDSSDRPIGDILNNSNMVNGVATDNYCSIYDYRETFHFGNNTVVSTYSAAHPAFRELIGVLHDIKAAVADKKPLGNLESRLENAKDSLVQMQTNLSQERAQIQAISDTYATDKQQATTDLEKYQGVSVKMAKSIKAQAALNELTTEQNALLTQMTAQKIVMDGFKELLLR